MSEERWTREELAGKVEWEGGVPEAITGYGISPRDLPESTPPEVMRAWIAVYESRKDIDLIDHWLETGEVLP